MALHDRFLQTLAIDDTARARFVEALRHSAELIEQGGGLVDVPLAAAASAGLALELRTAAQALCDHVRIRANGVCRYCELLFPERAG